MSPTRRLTQPHSAASRSGAVRHGSRPEWPRLGARGDNKRAGGRPVQTTRIDLSTYYSQRHTGQRRLSRPLWSRPGAPARAAAAAEAVVAAIGGGGGGRGLEDIRGRSGEEIAPDVARPSPEAVRVGRYLRPASQRDEPDEGVCGKARRTGWASQTSARLNRSGANYTESERVNWTLPELVDGIC